MQSYFHFLFGPLLVLVLQLAESGLDAVESFDNMLAGRGRSVLCSGSQGPFEVWQRLFDLLACYTSPSTRSLRDLPQRGSLVSDQSVTARGGPARNLAYSSLVPISLY